MFKSSGVGEEEEAVGEVGAEEAFPGFESAAGGLDPIAVECFEAGAMEQVSQSCGVLPVGVVFVDHGFAVAPDFPGLALVEGIWSGNDQDAVGFEMPVHVAEEEAGVFEVFDELAGDDGVELFLEVHGFDVVALGVVAHFFEDFDAGRVDVDAEGVFVELENALEEEVGFVVDAFLGRVLGGAGVDAAQVEDVAGFDVGGDDVEAVGDGFGEHRFGF